MDLGNFTDVLGEGDDEIGNSQPFSFPSTQETTNHGVGIPAFQKHVDITRKERPSRGTGQRGEFRSVEEIESTYRDVFTYPYFNLVQSSVIDDALYSDKSMVVCAPTGSGKTVVFEMAIVQLLMELDDKKYTGDFKIIYMAPVKAVCSERLSEWYPKFTKLGLMCIEVTGDTNVDFSQLKPYRIIITTPEKWDMLTRRWRDHKAMVEVIKLFLIDEVHILNDDCRGPVLEAVVSRMKTIESSSQSAHRIEQLQRQYQNNTDTHDEQEQIGNNNLPVRIRFIAISATVSNPEDVAAWLGTKDKPAVFYKFGDECRPVKLKRVVEGYPCSEGTSIFKFDIILNYKLWPVIQKYHDGKPTLIFCNTRKSVALTADMLSRELTVSFTPEQQARLSALASSIKNKKLQTLVLSGVGCHHAGLLFEERLNIEQAFRNRDLPILITTTTLAMGVNLPAHLVIIKNTQQYVNGAYQEYSISTVLQMVGRAGRPQFDTEATAVILTRLQDKPRYQALVGGDEPLQSYLHKRLAENLNSEAALGTVCDVAQCVQWLRSTFLSVRAAKDPKRYLGLTPNAPPTLISKKIEELCVKAMNGLASSGLITMDEASCIESTEAGRLMSVFYLDLETMKHIMKIEGTETLEKLLLIVCESHELADMHLRVDERRTLNTLNRNNASATIRFPMKGKISSRQMKLNCIIQAILGCLPIPDPSLNQEAMKVMRIADRVCKCLVAYVTRPDIIANQPQYFTAILNALTLSKCIDAHLWENSPYVSKQLKGIGPTFSTLLATAGKVNFTLLEESHPRDLERIMNKGAPAGNVLRKQVSLLPKYQLTATPIDQKRITIQLLLLNQHHLAENQDQLTAGDSHMCHVVVGDSENYLLLFTSFKDRDLINVYDGTIKYEVTRKHNFEHKILIHCISAKWVGIDVQCDFLFKNIEPPFLRGEAINMTLTKDTPIRNTTKQTCMTDVYKERKRKNNEPDLIESKEKKKRDTALVEKFKHLKNSFDVTSKELREDLDKSAHISNMIMNEMINTENKFNKKQIHHQSSDEILNFNPASGKIEGSASSDYDFLKTNNIETLNDEDNFEVDERIDSILSKIETEISKKSPNCASSILHQDMSSKPTNSNLLVKSSFFTKPMTQILSRNPQSRMSSNSSNTKLTAHLATGKSLYEKRKRKAQTHANSNTNYSFIDKIENKAESESDAEASEKDSGFSDAIKSQIEKFLRKSAKTPPGDITINRLLDYTDMREPAQLSPKSITRRTNTDRILNENSSLLKDDIPSSLDLSSFNIKKDKTDETKINLTSENTQEVNNIAKIVENIERDYNLSMKTINNIDAENDTAKKKEVFENTDVIVRFNDDYKFIPPKCNMNVRKNFIKANSIERVVLPKQDCDNGIILNNENYEDLNIKDILSRKRVLDHYNLEKVQHNLLTKTALVEIARTPYISENINLINSNKPVIERPLTPRSLQYIHKDFPCDESNSYYNRNSHTSQGLPSKKLNPKTDTSAECDITFTKLKSQLPEINESNLIDTYDSKCNHDQHLTSAEAANNQKHEDYVNKYSFSATKIDVCTKNLPNQQIKVIRKLKLDVDVTQIISSGYNSNEDTHTDQMSNQENTNSIQKPGATKQSLSCYEVKEKSLPYTELTFSKEARFLTTINKQTNVPTEQIEEMYSSKEKTVQNKTILPYTYNEENKVSKKGPIIESQKYMKSEEDIEQYKHYLREIAAANALVNSEDEKTGRDNFAETNSTVPEKLNFTIENGVTKKEQQCERTKNNKIENILLKYSALLRKHNNMLNIASPDENLSKDVTQKPLEKRRKLYKISDIQNLHIPLPKSLIAVEATRTPRPTNNDIYTRIKNIEKSPDCQGLKTPSKMENKNDLNMEVANNNTINNYENILQDIPEYHSPVTDNTQLELAEDYDLDQSMLNPKTLLEQCFHKDKGIRVEDNIIPPPLGFCDTEPIYSPVKSDCFDVDLTFQENCDMEQGNTLNYLHNKSIFVEDNNSVLTPSIEIETWTLSHDDNEEMNTDDFKRQIIQCNSNASRDEINSHNLKKELITQSYPNTNKSCTVMRRNKPVGREFSPNLGHYKFTHKDKLEM